MIHENTDKNAVYTVFEGDLEDLAENATNFCKGKYGDKCEFYRVSIERTHPEGNSWKVHDFNNFDKRAVKAIKNHLKARRDLVRLSFGGAETDYKLDFLICPARNTSQLARYVKKEHLENFSDDDLVVLSVERRRDEIDEEQRELLESLER